MAEWNEHILQITAEMTKRSKERLKNSVIDALTEGARVDFNNSDNLAGLHQLAHTMRKIFAAAGNTSIDFEKMIELPGPELFDGLKKAAKEFESVWASAVSNMGSYSLKDYFMEDATGISIALKKMRDQNGRIIKEQAKDILRAFEPIKKSNINELVDDLSASEGAMQGARTWEDRTAAALRYINVYERLLKLTDGDIDMREVSRDLMPFAKTIFDPKKKVAGLASIDELRKAMPAMQTSLQNIFNMAMGKPLLGLLEGGKINLEFAPVVIDKLDVGDLFNKNFKNGELKIPIIPEVAPDFEDKLTKLFEAYQKRDAITSGEIEEQLLADIPEDMYDKAFDRLSKIGELKNLTNRSVKAIWKDFIGYGLPVGGDGSGSGIGSGTGDGYDIGSTSEEVIHINDAEVESNKKKIQSYDELSNAVSRYVELAKSLVSTTNDTKDHQQITADMGRFSWNHMPGDEQGYIDAINKQKKNIDKIKSAIKIGASTYTDEDGYEYSIVDDTLAEAESKLRSYIYHYASEFDDIGTLVDGAKTKNLKNIIDKEVNKFKADEAIQRQQEEIAEAANVAAIEEMEQIEEMLKRSAPDEKSDKISKNLEELKSDASRVDRFTQSVRTDMLADDIGIISPHKEIENNAKAIKSYEELCSVVERYNELVKKRWVFTGDEYPTLNAEEENEYADLYGRLKATRDDVNIHKLTGFDGITDIEKLAQLLGIKIPQATQQAKQSVIELNNELKTTGDKADNVDGKLGDGVATGAGQSAGTTTEEVKNLEAVRAKVAEITAAVDTKTQAFKDEAAAVNTAVDSEVKSLGELEAKVTTVKTTFEGLLNNIKTGADDVGAGLNNITVNVNHQKNEEQDKSTAINKESLKQTLSDVIYKVKIAHDDNDKTANKIAIDENILESVLKRVFVKELSPQAEQPKTEPKKETSAIEKTLLGIKETLGQVQANTAKIEPQQSINNVENALSAIKTATESVDKKIVRGTKTVIGGEDIDTKKKPKAVEGRDAQILAERIATQKLALKKFKTELTTSGKMTDDVAKKIRGLAISLGMVKDSKGLTRWGEKFKQQKLGVGITDIATKESIAEQNANIKEWISLSKQLGELDAKINSGLFDDAVIAQAKQEREFVLRKIDEVMALIKNPDDGFMGAGEANFAGRNDTINTQKSKKIGQLVSQYEKLGQLQARAETSGAFVDREKYQQLSREVQSETEILHLHEEQNAELLKALQSRQENAYISEKDIEYAKEQKRLFTEYVSIIKQIGKLDGVIGSDTADVISKQNAQTEKDALMRLADGIRPQLDLTREDLISAGAASMAGEEVSAITQRQKALTDLAKQHKELGKLQAQEAHTQVAELQKKIDAQRVVLQLTQEEQDVLAQITEDAKQDALNKQTDKDTKKATADQKKLDKRRAMVGKAGSSISRAEGVWLEAEGLEQAKLPDGFKKQVSEYYDTLDQLRLKHHEINTSKVVTEEQQAELIRQTKEVNKLTEAIGPLVAEYQKLSGANVDENKSRATTLTGASSLNDYEAQLKQYAKSITDGKAQIKSFNAETKTLTYTVKTGKNEFTEYTAAVRHLDRQMVAVQGTTKRTETFFEATVRKMKELTSYFSGMAVFNRIGQELRRGIQYVREIDDALVELRKVTDETDESYDKFLRTAAKTGSVIGATISEVTEATATFSKLGYDMEMATEMAESAIVYKNVGDNIASAEDAADSIISTLKGFRLESSETMRIVDRFNEVGKSIAHVI